MNIFIRVILILGLQLGCLYIGDYIYYVQYGYSTLHPAIEKAN